MGLLLKLLTAPVTGPLDGVFWLAGKIVDQAENELYNEATIRGKLVELELRYDMGEISEEDFFVVEEHLLAQLKVARERAALSN